MIFAQGSWGWAWSPKAYMFDSCLTGFSISSSVVPPEKVGEIGRIQERSRWRLGAEKARTAALTAAGFAMSDSALPPSKMKTVNWFLFLLISAMTLRMNGGSR